MENHRFDRLAAALSAREVGRRTLGGLALALGLRVSLSDEGDAKKKRKKRNKKNTKKGNKPTRCQSFGGVTLTCDPGWQCCDPVTSTIAACRRPGFPVCCASDEFAHPVGTTCCRDITSGIDGVCDDPAFPNCCTPSEGAGCCAADFPVCCPVEVEGCCPLNLPVCCANACCPIGNVCAEDGFCSNGTGSSAARDGQVRGSSVAKGERRHRSDARSEPLG